MLEGRRPILFKGEVPDPSKAVAEQGHGQQPPGGDEHTQNERDENEKRADKVQQTAAAIAVLAQIIGIEITKA